MDGGKNMMKITNYDVFKNELSKFINYIFDDEYYPENGIVKNNDIMQKYIARYEKLISQISEYICNDMVFILKNGYGEIKNTDYFGYAKIVDEYFIIDCDFDFVKIDGSEKQIICDVFNALKND